jgi:hypothetical protein
MYAQVWSRVMGIVAARASETKCGLCVRFIALIAAISSHTNRDHIRSSPKLQSHPLSSSFPTTKSWQKRSFLKFKEEVL